MEAAILEYAFKNKIIILNLFLKIIHAHTYLTHAIFYCRAKKKKSFHMVTLGQLYFYKAYLQRKKINIHCDLVTSQSPRFAGSQLHISKF